MCNTCTNFSISFALHYYYYYYYRLLSHSFSSWYFSWTSGVLTAQASTSPCSTFRIMCDVFCNESIECFPGISSKFFLKLLISIPLASIITGIIVHFRFHIRCISIPKPLHFNSFSASFCTTFFFGYCHTYQCACFIFFSLLLLVVVVVVVVVVQWVPLVWAPFSILLYCATLFRGPLCSLPSVHLCRQEDILICGKEDNCILYLFTID